MTHSRFWQDQNDAQDGQPRLKRPGGTERVEVIDRESILKAERDELAELVILLADDLAAARRELQASRGALQTAHRKLGPQPSARRLDDQARGDLHRVNQEAQRTRECFDGIVQIAHVGHGEVERTDVDLTALGHQVVAELVARGPERDVCFTIAGGMRARGDRRLLEMLLEQVFDNAWKFTSKTKGAEIFFGRDRENPASFFIRDNGVGFATRSSERLFEPFERLHPADEFEGKGLGLAIARRIIDRHRGRIWAEGEAGRGAIIHFTLE